MNSVSRTSLKKRELVAQVKQPPMTSIEGNKLLRNLADKYWVYRDFLNALERSGWRRVAAGFKAGVYAHPDWPYCAKVLGMGVGDDPTYFCERGYYLAHERQMLECCQDRQFKFAPNVLPRKDSIDFLVNACQVDRDQAEQRVQNDDILLVDYIPGVPFFTRTGHFLNGVCNIESFERPVLEEMVCALYALRDQVRQANEQGFLHNDPTPANIIFSIDSDGRVVARLVDYELAQDLTTSSPPHVNNSVAELYNERGVPRNPYTGRHITNLDQYLLDEVIRYAEQVAKGAPEPWSLGKMLNPTLRIGPVSISLGGLLDTARRKLRP